MVRDEIIKVVVSTQEKTLLKSNADKQGNSISNFLRQLGLDYCYNRLVRIENLTNLPQFESLITQNTELLTVINQLQEMVRDVNNSYELNRDQNLDSIAKLEISNKLPIEEKILKILENNSLFLDQIGEKLPGENIKIILKVLANLRNIGKVEQDIQLRWFKC